MTNNRTDAAFSGGGGIVGTNITLSNSTVSGNRTAGAFSSGGGIYSTGSVRLTNTTIDDDHADGTFADGGGIHLLGTAASSVINSTISRNSAATNGGGIFRRHHALDIPLTITNSTISGNTSGGVGGGIFNSLGLAVLEFSTITDNLATGGHGWRSGVAGRNDTSTKVRSSIIAGNPNSDVDFVDGETNSFMSLGYNLFGDGNATTAFTALGDQPTKSPMLFALASNGGSTETHLPIAGSPAIDAGNPNVFPGVGGVPVFDQRDSPFLRVQDGNGDGTR